MDIIYYGEKEKQFVFLPYADSHNLTYELNNIVTFNLSAAVINDIMIKSPAELIIDADCITDYDCCNKLSDIKEAIGCKLVIIALGYDKTSVLIKKFTVSGIRNFVLPDVLGNARNDYANIHQGTATVSKEEVYEAKSEAVSREIIAGNDFTREDAKKLLTVGVCGCIERIGTTTLALQLAKHFRLQGRKVAFLERNKTGFIAATKEAYKCEEDEALGKVSFDDVDMFYDLSLIKRIIADGYDCLIYDYGVSTNENVVSILEQDEIFICCGLKNKELSGTYEVLRRFLHSDGSINYCFNFVHPSLHSQTLSMMGKKADKTMFLGYTPEMLILEGENHKSFEKLLLHTEEAEERKKFKWNLRKKR